jgi:hypothetical protein
MRDSRLMVGDKLPEVDIKVHEDEERDEVHDM